MGQARAYPVKAYWVYDPAGPASTARLVFAASPSCAIGKVCDAEGISGIGRRNLHSCIATFARWRESA